VSFELVKSLRVNWVRDESLHSLLSPVPEAQRSADSFLLPRILCSYCDPSFIYNYLSLAASLRGLVALSIVLLYSTLVVVAHSSLSKFISFQAVVLFNCVIHYSFLAVHDTCRSVLTHFECFHASVWQVLCYYSSHRGYNHHKQGLISTVFLPKYNTVSIVIKWYNKVLYILNNFVSRTVNTGHISITCQ